MLLEDGEFSKATELCEQVLNADPENAEAYQELQSYTENWAIQPQESAISANPHSALFRFQENSAGIRQCEVSFSEQCCSLTFLTERGTEQLRAGFGHFEYSLFQLTDTCPHPVAAYAVWTNKEVLEIRSLICDGTFRDIWTINFSDTEEPLNNRILCSCFRPAKPRLLLRKDI